MGVVNEVRPDEGVTFLGVYFKALVIFGDFDSVVCLVLDVEGMFDFFFIDEEKAELIGVVGLVYVDPNILKFSGDLGWFELESHGSGGGGVACKIAADKSLVVVDDGDEVDLG